MKVAIIAAFLISSLSAETTKVDNLKVGSREYKNAEVTKIDSIFARVVHSDGSARIALADLPADVQAALKYDAAADTSSRENAKKTADAAAETARIELAPKVRPVIG